mgnify:CR=1 FL=1
MSNVADDATEQFAEIMDRTIQEAADADERTHAAEVELAAAVAAQDDFARLTAARTAIMTASACDAEEELAQAEEDAQAWEDCAFNRKEEIDQLKAENDELMDIRRTMVKTYEGIIQERNDELKELRGGGQEEEIDQLSALLERAQRSHVDQRKEIKELKAEIAQLRVVASGCQPVWPFSNWHSDAGRALGEVREYLDRFDHDEVDVFDKIMEKECPDWLSAFKADQADSS